MKNLSEVMLKLLKHKCNSPCLRNKNREDAEQKPLSMTLRFSKGFTLIELLVVVLIIGILSAVALPQYQKSVEKARASEANINLKALEDAMKVYVLERGEPAQDLDDLSISLPGEKISERKLKTKFFTYYISLGSNGRGYEIIAYRNAGNNDAANYYLYYSYQGQKNCVAKTEAAKAICSAFCMPPSFNFHDGSYYCGM